MSGTLLIVGTPIGNLSDITQRTKDAIANSDLVFVEDTRITIKLLNHLNLKKKMISCHEFNEAKRLDLLEQANTDGKTVALITDAGMPLICDPGYLTVRHAISIGMKVVPIPGPSAFLLALAGSGLAVDRFVFEGFLPDRINAIKKRLEDLKQESRTLIFYISPHKLLKTLTLLREILGNRTACLARELTKIHEEFVRGTVDELLQWLISVKEVRGEFVVIVEGAANTVQSSNEDIQEAIENLVSQGMRAKEIANVLASKFEQKKSDIYKLATDYINK